MSPRPNCLFHYQPIDTASAEKITETIGWIARTLNEDEVRFSSPASFNDPFDCKIELSLEATETEKRTYVEKLPVVQGCKDRDKREHLISEIINSPEKIAQGYRNYLHKLLKQYGVYCFSELSNDILMWSHYANSHRGICLVFSGATVFAGGTVRELPVMPVQYPDNNQYPEISLFDADERKKMKAILLTKALQWKYEREWRAVDYRESGYHRIEPSWITGIIFGCQIAKDHKSQITDAAERRRGARQVKLWQAKKKNREFALSIEPL